MKKDYVHINVVLDRSGSMHPLAKATVDGFNEFLGSQRNLPGEVTISVAQFDDYYELVHDFDNINNVANWTAENFVPRGWTALYGAIGKTIDDVGKRLAAMPESQRPTKVVTLIITDGHENYSHNTKWGSHYNRHTIRKMVEHQQTQYGWEFIYLGANQDAILAAEEIGIAARNTSNYHATNIGTKAVYNMFAEKLSTSRSTGDYSSNLAFSPDDKKTLSTSK